MMKFYLVIAAITVLLSSCYKQSIADAMLNDSGKQTTTATLSYEINGNKVTLAVEDADNQPAGNRKLYFGKSNGYYISAIGNGGDFIYTLYTDNLTVGSYPYTSNFGPLYITTFEGRPQYIYGPTDHMNFNITSYKDGYVNGNFSGQLTPLLVPSNVNNIYGTAGSVVIRNGTFSNVPVLY